MIGIRAVRLGLAGLLFAAGCGASNEVSPPLSKPPQEKKASPPWVEILDRGARSALVLHGADGSAKAPVEVTSPREIVVTPEGRACFVADEGKQPVPVVSCLDAGGKLAWTDVAGRGAQVRLFLAGDVLQIYHLAGSEDGSGKAASRGASVLRTFEVASGEGRQQVRFPGEAGDVARSGEVLVFAERDRVARRTPAGEVVWQVRARLFPTTDPEPRTHGRKVAVSAQGIVLTGASDGSLLAFDRDGKALYQLGVRGAVSRIEARADGDFVVRADGVATVLGPGGEVRREVPEIAEPEERAGVVDRRSREAGAFARTTLRYRAELQRVAGKPLEEIAAVVVLAKDDVFALDESAAHRLYHFDGKAWTERASTVVKFRKEVFVEGVDASESELYATDLARGPRGELLVLGRRMGPAGGRFGVLEYRDGALRERTNLSPALAKIRVDVDSVPVYTVSPKGREVLCGAKMRGCVEAGPGITPRALSLEEGQSMPGIEGNPTWGPLPRLFAGETLWKVRGAVTTEGDVIGFGDRGLLLARAGDVRPLASPLSDPRSVWASSSTDVWVSDRDALVRFDGRQWWQIPSAGGEVTGSGPDDVWVHRGTLWHVTPDPRARPDIEVVTGPAPRAAPPSEAMRIAGVDTAYRLERAAMDVDKGPPLRTAVSVVEGPGGVRWLHEGSRVIEHDGAVARVLHEAKKPELFHCWAAPEPDCNLCASCSARRPYVAECYQCAAPSGAGEGAMIVDGEWLWARGGATAPETVRVGPFSAMAAVSPGVVWAVSADQRREPGVLVQDKDGSRFVNGLPPGLYTAMAFRAPDDGWLAGGLGMTRVRAVPYPGGEGTLVRFDGRAFTRSRAPEGALFAVTATGPNEAWAVGHDGGVLRSKGGTTSAFHVEREDGERLRVVLRAVAGGAGEVFFAGEGATLLRWDGAALRRVDTKAAGRSAFSGLIAPSGERPGWVTGPGGMWRLVRVP